MKALEVRVTSTHKAEFQGFDEKLSKTFESCMMRIKTCEVYCKDKIRDLNFGIKDIESSTKVYATKK